MLKAESWKLKAGRAHSKPSRRSPASQCGWNLWIVVCWKADERKKPLATAIWTRRIVVC